MSTDLKAGEFFGQVPRKLLTPVSVMTEVVHTRRTSVPTHSHELGHFQLLIVGSYAETIGSRRMTPAPMSISWHRPGMTHRDEIGVGGSRFFMIEMRPEAIARFEEIAKLPADFCVRGDRLVSMAGRLYHEFGHWDLGSELVAEGIALEMLAALARTSHGAENRPPHWLRRVVDKIDAEFVDGVASEDLAREAGVHPVHLAASFRKHFGETVGERVQRKRVELAARLLTSTADMPIADVAAETGFADQSHLTRTFKKITGRTPGEYRRAFGLSVH
jgi:AraC family transcriptional regulator